MKKMYCLVVTDDYSRFTWVFFLATKDETSGILKSFITGIENLVYHKVKVIRCDNGREFKNKEMNQTLIEAARTMLADSKFPTTFWAEAVNTACYVQNRVCPITILNTIDHLGKFDGKADECFFVRYSLNSKAFRAFNSRTMIVEENLYISSKTTAWNEFSSTMASAIICLATNQKFNFSKYIFESMIRNLDNLSGKFLMYPRKPKRKDTQVPQPSDPIENVADEAVHKELGDSLVRAATTASSLEAEQDSGNINKTQSKATPNESSSLGTTSGGGPRCQETMGDTIAQTRFENVSKHSNDSLLARGNTLQSDEDRLKLDELMALCTTLQNRVLDLEKTKTTQHNEIASLKRRVKKLEKKNRSSDNEESLCEDASKQGRIDAIDAYEEITLVSVQNVDEEMFDVNVLDGEEVFVREQEVVVKDVNNEVNVVEEVVEVINSAKLITDVAQVSVAGNVVSTSGDATTISAATTTTATITTVDDITLAQALMEIKSTKPKEKGVVIRELGESTTTISSQLSLQQSQDKGKGILIKLVKPMKKKDLIRLDEEAALKLQAEFDEEERLTREKAEKEKEANFALIETWDDIQAKVDVDHQLAERLQAQEQEELSIEEKATLFQQLLEKRRKHFAAKRAEEKRNKPPTKEMFNRAFKRVNTFEDSRTELVEGKEKRVGTELIQENAKKQKVEDDKEIAELKQCLEIIPDEEEVTIDAIPLAVKSPSIIGWKIYKEGRKSYYQIMRDYGKSQTYMIFCQMLKSFNRQDLEDLYKLVKAK
ncbi:retrovirus-related pol polyprotein from transposon TNT 1-94 [Tanacetum coccineum]